MLDTGRQVDEAIDTTSRKNAMTHVKGMSCALGAIMVAAFALSVNAQQVRQPLRAE
jgi:hypothetical protein